jgi:hypothetical protein
MNASAPTAAMAARLLRPMYGLVRADLGHGERLRPFLDQRRELRVVVAVAVGDRRRR